MFRQTTETNTPGMPAIVAAETATATAYVRRVDRSAGCCCVVHVPLVLVVCRDPPKAEVSALRTLADRTLAQLAEADERAEQASARADRLERDLSSALAAADAVRAEAKLVLETVETLRRAEESRKARGRWARLRAAWQGE
jgi:hypothetical protein